MKEILTAAGIVLDIFETQSAGDATKIAAEKLPAAYSAVVVFGGDGTVSEVVQARSVTGFTKTHAHIPSPGFSSICLKI